jgi:hypothetical protein
MVEQSWSPKLDRRQSGEEKKEGAQREGRAW